MSTAKWFPSLNQPSPQSSSLQLLWLRLSCCSSFDGFSIVGVSSTFLVPLRPPFCLVRLVTPAVRFPALIAVSLGHDYAYACQEEACTLEFQWMCDYGTTWRTRGAFRVSRRPSLFPSSRLMKFCVLQNDVLMTVDPKVGCRCYYCHRTYQSLSFTFYSRLSNTSCKSLATIMPRR